jgi:hypothetical protein
MKSAPLVLAGLGVVMGVAVGAQQPAAPARPLTMPAVNSQIGGAYPIDELEHTLTYTLESVSVASRFASANSNVVATGGKRLLVITSSLTNIQKFTYPLNAQAVMFNVFNESGERFLNSLHSFILPGLTSFPTDLKTKEKLRYVAVMEIHGQGPITRLAAVKGARTTRRAWYDVEKDLTIAPSVFASGNGLVDRAETRMGTTFDLGAFDMTVESAGPVASAGSYQSSSSGQVYAVTVKVTNMLKAPEKFGWQYGKATLTDTSGKDLNWTSDIIDTATGKSVVGELVAGQPYVVQYAFNAERGRALKTFTLAMNGGRTIVVDLK